MERLAEVAREGLRTDIPAFDPGDTVRVMVRVREGDKDYKSATRDVALIMAAQKIEHYEIATYGGLVTLAKNIGREDVAEILAQTLEEEKETDELLTSIAESSTNMEAASEDEEETEE